MKTKLFFVILFFAGIVSAQSELWPTANAEWHYGITSMSINGFVKIKIDRDTVINGRNCQIYTREYKWKNTAIPIYKDSIFQGVNDSWFILSVEDSVLYAFNKYHSQFDTILNFNAEIGDRWKFYPNIDMCDNDTNAHIFIELTGKNTAVVNGENLLTFSTKNIPTEADVSFHGSDVIFHQKIGVMEEYFVPRFCYGVAEYAAVSLRCFTENKGLPNEFSYHRGSFGCESILKVGTDLSQHEFTVINPVLDNVIRIKGLDMSTLAGVKLFDNLGKELKVAIATEQDSYMLTPEKHLTAGIYFCALEFANGQKQTVKISIYN